MSGHFVEIRDADYLSEAHLGRLSLIYSQIGDVGDGCIPFWFGSIHGRDRMVRRSMTRWGEDRVSLAGVSAEAGFTSAESNFATKRQFEYKWLATNFNSRLKAPWFHNETRANYGFT